MLARRIFIYGVTGSGKTTFAAQLAEALGLPWISVDELTWEPNWTPVPREIQRERFTKICAEDAWILDTAYGQWVDIPLGRVELIVFLDYPRWLSLGRLLKRCIIRIVDRKPICNGNRETFVNTFFSRGSILAWHFRSFKVKRERVALWEALPKGPKVIRLRNPREAEAWLRSAAKEAASALPEGPAARS